MKHDQKLIEIADEHDERKLKQRIEDGEPEEKGEMKTREKAQTILFHCVFTTSREVSQRRASSHVSLLASAL